MMRMSTAAQQLDAQRGVTPPGETATPKVTIGGRAGIVEKIHDQENVRAVVATVGVQGMKPYATDTDEILAQCVQDLIAAAQAKAAAERSDIEGHLAGLKITLDGAAAATADTAQALVGCVTFMQTDGPRDGGGPYVATVEVRGDCPGGCAGRPHGAPAADRGAAGAACVLNGDNTTGVVDPEPA